MTDRSESPPSGALAIEKLPCDLFAIRFNAMAGPCELLLYGAERANALALGTLVAAEAWRVEHKYSRYRDDSVVAWIHRNRGMEIRVDEETAALLEFASRCFELSDGLFDVTSGVLRRAWRFDGSNRIPDPATVARLLPLVGFAKLHWRSPQLMLPVDMELDFGGIGKEYAVDRAYDLLASQCSGSFLINFGGDLRANMPPPYGPWQVGIERPDSE